MPKLPVISGPELVKALERVGFHVKRQRGSPDEIVKLLTLVLGAYPLMR